MDILWEPEIGHCTECGHHGRIRHFSSEGAVRRFCFPCWNREQEPFVVSSREWVQPERIVFVYPPILPSSFPPSEPPSWAA